MERKTLDADMEGWIEFDVQRPVAFWQTNSLHNNGFQIEITDSNESRLSAHRWIHAMNCSGKLHPSFSFPFSFLVFVQFVSFVCLFNQDQRAALPNLLILQPKLAAQLNLSGVSLNERRRYPTLDIFSVLLSEQQANSFRRRTKHRNTWQADTATGSASGDSGHLMNSKSVASISAMKRRLVKRHLIRNELSEQVRGEMIQQLLQNFNTRKVYSPILEKMSGDCQLLAVNMEMPKMFFDQQVLYPDHLQFRFCTNQVSKLLSLSLFLFIINFYL